MPCNLNFNECRSGGQYPTPMFSCFRNLIEQINTSPNIIINPLPTSSINILAQTF
ncbi:MAG: hypothetical protein J6K97_02080 [Clostridia bacterium]|nr:hypothetical protein [Clostridia bacterium]